MKVEKNLFDISKEIERTISYINKNDEHIISVAINQRTLNYIKRKGIHGFSDAFNKEIPVIINEFLIDGQVIFNREKNIKPTEYEPYKEVRLGGDVDDE